MPARSPTRKSAGPAIDEDAQKKCAALVPFMPRRATALEYLEYQAFDLDDPLTSVRR
jgi:hypothetical protein